MIVVNPIIRMIAKVASYLLYAATLLSAFGGYFNPRYFTLPAMAVLILPYLAIATFIVAILWLLRKRLITGALGILVLIAGWGSISHAVPLHTSKKARPGEPTFTLVSYNIFHTTDTHSNDSTKSRAIDYLIKTDADIVCLQELYGFNTYEVRDHQAVVDSLLALYPYHKDGAQSDMKVLSKYPVKRIKLYHPDPKYSAYYYTFWEVNVKGFPITLVNVHLPSYNLNTKERTVISGIHNSTSARSSMDRFKALMKGKLSEGLSSRAEATAEVTEILRQVEGRVIVCGDFNDVPGSWAYRTFIKEGYKDAFAETHFGPMHTYNSDLLYFHLDQVLYRGALKALSLKRGNINASDHYPLEATFAIIN